MGYYVAVPEPDIITIFYFQFPLWDRARRRLVRKETEFNFQFPLWDTTTKWKSI